MSFSHLYNLTKTKQYTTGEAYDDEDHDMGAYGVPIGSSYGSKPTYNSKYDDAEYSPKNKAPPETSHKADPFGWDNPKASSQKFESKSKPKQAFDDFEDTGDDGWNDVKRSVTEVKHMVDPYSNSGKKTASYDTYFEDDRQPTKAKQFNFDDDNNRQKAVTITKKSNDFFSQNYSQSSGSKKDDFDSSTQPKVFDFNEFGGALDKKTKKDDFGDVFSNPLPKAKSTSDDPFSWGDDNTQQKSKPKADDFNFDFGSKNKKTDNAKKNVADFLDEHTEKKKDNFDPFDITANDNKGGAAIHDLASVGIKFDYPEMKQATNKVTNNVFGHDNDPVIESEDLTDKKEKEIDPADPWAKKELFNLNNLSKEKKSKLQMKKDDTLENVKIGNNNSGSFNSKISSGFGAMGTNDQFSGSVSGSSFSNTFNTSSMFESKEAKLNALESAFGSTIPQPIPQSMPVKNSAGDSRPTASHDDFGDFPTMFGSSSDGFGNFSGFGNDDFSGAPSSNTFESKPKVKPAEKKKDDWFEF